MIGKVLHPAVGGGAVPVFHTFGNGDGNAWLELHGLLAPLLIPTAATHAQEHLLSAMMDVPVVAATGLECHVAKADGRVQYGQIALPDEVLGKSSIRLP